MCLNAEKIKAVSYAGTLDCLSNCGYCSECYFKKTNQWKVRLHYEHLDNPAMYAVVLTYDKERFGSPLLNYKDVQDYHKRLRKAGYKFRFFTSGEYGEERGRAHYHDLLFGLEPDISLRLYEKKSNGHDVFKSKELSRIWGKGVVYVQRVSGLADLVGYMTKYFNKETFGFSSEAFRAFLSVCANHLEHENRVWFSMDYLYECVKALDDPVRAKRLLDKYRPKHLHSLSLGYDAWLRRIDDYVRDDGIWIGGFLCKAPVSWIKKYCAPLFSADYLRRIEEKGFNLSLSSARELYSFVLRKYCSNPTDQLYREYRKAKGFFHSLDRHLSNIRLPVGRYAGFFFNQYHDMLVDFDIDMEVFDASNRVDNFDHVKYLDILRSKTLEV